MASRDLAELLPGTRAKVEAWLTACEAAGLKLFVMCTYRSQDEQDALYAQGRELYSVVNALRKRVGLPLISLDENRRKVTWTRKSQHSSRRAVDFGLKLPNPWDLKADVDCDAIADFREAGELAKLHGLQWGIWNGKGEHVDLGHVQDNQLYQKEVA